MSTIMTPELQKYYENYADLFLTDGWKQFQEDIQAAALTINIMSLKDAKDLHISQGKLDVFQRLLNWQNSIENAYEEILNEEKEGSS
mgnify:CR=1 FL=1|tara:strand:- start:1060 stop:1320 length:261 start_codon:yes stop_codon:yes gene_type:complete